MSYIYASKEREYKQVHMTENRWKFMNILLFI